MRIPTGVLRFTVLASVALAGALGAQTGPSQGDLPEPGYSLTITAFKPTVALGSNVSIAIRISNVTKEPITFLFGRWGNTAVGFEYDVRDEDGKPLKKVHHSDRPPKGPGQQFMGAIPPGRSVEEATLLSDSFEFDQPGTNTVQISHKEPGKAIVRSNVIAIRVVEPGDAPEGKR